METAIIASILGSGMQSQSCARVQKAGEWIRCERDLKLLPTACGDTRSAQALKPPSCRRAGGRAEARRVAVLRLLEAEAVCLRVSKRGRVAATVSHRRDEEVWLLAMAAVILCNVLRSPEAAAERAVHMLKVQHPGAHLASVELSYNVAVHALHIN